MKLPPEIAIDTETTGLNWRDEKIRLTHISSWDLQGHGQVLKIGRDDLTYIKEILTSPKVVKIFFNAKFDLNFLESRLGIKVAGEIIDVMVIARMIFPDELQYNLKYLSRKFLKCAYQEEIVLKKWLRANKDKTHGEAPDYLIEPYALKDAQNTYELYSIIRWKLRDWKLWPVYRTEQKLLPVIRRMESVGFHIRKNFLAKLHNLAIDRLEILQTKLAKLSGNPNFNPNSHKQVTELVYDGRQRPTGSIRFSKKTGKPSADGTALLKIQNEASRTILAFRKTSKAFSTYIEGIDRATNGGFRLYPQLNQCGTRTGRFSSSEPNLQNLPRAGKGILGSIRGVFGARKGYKLFFIDYDQLEIRLAAHFSGEKHMIEAIRSNKDLHGETCKLLFNIEPDHPDWKTKRFIAKTINFAVQYGAGGEKFADTMLKLASVVMTDIEASHIIDNYKSHHPGIVKLFDSVANEIMETGGIRNPFGRYMPVSRSELYVGVNYLIQSTAADLIKQRMLQIDDLINWEDVKMVMQVHDELIFEVEDTLDAPSMQDTMSAIKTTMEEHSMFKVPITCSASIGKNWLAKEAL